MRAARIASWLADALRVQEILSSRHSQYCANLKFSHPRRFPAEFLEMYRRGNASASDADGRRRWRWLEHGHQARWLPLVRVRLAKTRGRVRVPRVTPAVRRNFQRLCCVTVRTDILIHTICTGRRQQRTGVGGLLHTQYAKDCSLL